MKKLLIALLILLPFTIFAQNRTKVAPPKKKEVKTFQFDSTTMKITYHDVISLPERSKERIYNRMKTFATDPKNIIKDDQANGIFAYSARYSVKYPSPMIGIMHSGTVNYEVTFKYKDNEYEFTVTNFIHKGQQGDGGELENKKPACDQYLLSPQGWGSIKNQAITQNEQLVKSIIATIRIP